MTSDDRHSRMREIFDEARRIPESDRTSFLEESCGGDHELRSEIETLLSSHEAMGAFLATDVLPKSPLAAPFGEKEEAQRAAGLVGKRVGSFLVERVIASGGMGRVYEAKQENPHRRVALKVLRPGVASASALRRFEYEAEFLGRLRHPGVCEVYEAGIHREDEADADGIPFFAMEHIPDARSITEYADAEGLDIQERLELFARVCDAAHHGHQKGVIHRDLKPGNVLIDTAGRPKIIDFGVARATDSDKVVTTLSADFGRLLGTLPYMSPEQCETGEHDLDTRSDVYSLGVMLYELLCGCLPYDVSRANLVEATRTIREDPPKRPSAVRPVLTGDLETIVLKALEKDRERRYDSAAALGQDVGRYLAREPIEARPASIGYHLRMFANRNRLLCGSAAAVLLVLLLGIAGTGLALLRANDEAIRARRAESDMKIETDRLTAVNEFWRRVLEQSDPWTSRRTPDPEHPLTLVEVVSDAAQRLDTGNEYADQPLVEATLRTTIGNVYLALEQNEAAHAQHQRAFEIRHASLGEEHRQTIESMAILGFACLTLGRNDEAEELTRRAVAMSGSVLGTSDTTTHDCSNRLVNVLFSTGDAEGARSLAYELVDTAMKADDQDRQEIAGTYYNAAFLKIADGALEEAESLLTRTLEIRERILEPAHPDLSWTRAHIGRILVRRGRNEEGLGMLRKASEDFDRVLGPDNQQSLNMKAGFAHVLGTTGGITEAMDLLLSVLDREIVKHDGNPEVTGETTAMIKGFLSGPASREQAEAAVESWLRDRLDTESVTPGVHAAKHLLGRHLLEAGRFGEAEPLLLEIYDGYRELSGEDSDDCKATAGLLAKLYRRWDRPDDAAKWKALAR